MRERESHFEFTIWLFLNLLTMSSEMISSRERRRIGHINTYVVIRQTGCPNKVTSRFKLRGKGSDLSSAHHKGVWKDPSLILLKQMLFKKQNDRSTIYEMSTCAIKKFHASYQKLLVIQSKKN